MRGDRENGRFDNTRYGRNNGGNSGGNFQCISFILWNPTIPGNGKPTILLLVHRLISNWPGFPRKFCRISIIFHTIISDWPIFFPALGRQVISGSMKLIPFLYSNTPLIHSRWCLSQIPCWMSSGQRPTSIFRGGFPFRFLHDGSSAHPSHRRGTSLQ